MSRFISIIGPMYNEDKIVQEYCNKVSKSMSSIRDKYNYEIVLVNDGSNDDTYTSMLKAQRNNPTNISVVNLTRNFGLEGAVRAGLSVAKGDAIVVMDADLQDPPSLILKMIEKWEQGYDIVVACRIKREHDSFFKKITAKVFYCILDSLSGKLKIEHDAANFRLLSRKAVNKLLELPEVNTVFRVTVPYIGMKTTVIEYSREERFAGETKYSLSNMIPYALNSITGISVEPLRKLIIISFVFLVLFLFSLLGIVLSISNVWQTTFLIISVLFLGFTVLFTCLSIVAEYIAQITIEVKGRPTSIIYDYKPAKIVEKGDS